MKCPVLYGRVPLLLLLLLATAGMIAHKVSINPDKTAPSIVWCNGGALTSFAEGPVSNNKNYWKFKLV